MPIAILLARCHNAAPINRVLNHPDVRDGCGLPGRGDLDVSGALAIPENWFLLGEHGGFAMEQVADGVHDVHVFVLPSGRGRWAAEAAGEMVDYAKDHGDYKLLAHIPEGRSDVDAYARRVGFHPSGDHVEAFGVRYEIFEMELV